MHLLVDCKGQPLAITSTSSKGNERHQVTPLLEKAGVNCRLNNSYRRAMIIFEADRGYDADWLRADLLKVNIFPYIPRRKMGKESLNRPSNKAVREFFKIKPVRWVVERTFSWLKRQYRRLILRWERLPSVWESFLTAGLILNWVRVLSG